VWIGAIALALVLRFTLFFSFSSSERFYAFLVFLFLTWVPVILVNVAESQRLMDYFRAHDCASSSFLPFKMGRWFFSRDDHGDPYLQELRAERHRFGRFMFTVFFTYPVVFFIYAL